MTKRTNQNRDLIDLAGAFLFCAVILANALAADAPKPEPAKPTGQITLSADAHRAIKDGEMAFAKALLKFDAKMIEAKDAQIHASAVEKEAEPLAQEVNKANQALYTLREAKASEAGCDPKTLVEDAAGNYSCKKAEVKK